MHAWYGHTLTQGGHFLWDHGRGDTRPSKLSTRAPAAPHLHDDDPDGIRVRRVAALGALAATQRPPPRPELRREHEPRVCCCYPPPYHRRQG